MDEFTLLSLSDRLGALEKEQNNRLAGILSTGRQQQDIADRLDSIHRRPQNALLLFPPYEADPAVPLAQEVEVVQEDQQAAITHLAVRFTNPDPAQVARFEVYVERSAFDNEQPSKVWEGLESPAVFSVSADRDTTVVGRVRTVMKGGLGGSTLGGSPSFTTAVLKEGIDAGDIPDESIGDAKLDRTTDPIQIVNADIVNLQATKITAGTLDASVILASNIAATQISAGTLNAGVILASNIAATQISAGTLAAGVILASNIAATQISAGTMTAVNVSAGTFALTSGIQQMEINGTQGFKQTNTSTGGFTQLIGGTALIANSGGVGNILQPFTAWWESTGATAVVQIYSDVSDLGETNSGRIDVRDTSGNNKVQLGVDSNSDGIIQLDGHLSMDEITNTPANPASSAEARVYMKADKLVIQYNDAGTVRYKYLDLTGTGVTWTHTTTAP